MNIHDVYRPFLLFFRSKRMRFFEHVFKPASDNRVLDIGGTEFNWSFLSISPQLTMLNIRFPHHRKGEIRYVIADGCHLPFKELSFDIVYSNSVIEHLGNFENQSLFASECSRVGCKYFIQTPNKWFLIEPHLLTPFIHWMPKNIQSRLMRNFTLWGLITRPSQDVCDNFIKEVHLLDRKRFRLLFPDAKIWHERFIGFTKAFIAVKPSTLK